METKIDSVRMEWIWRLCGFLNGFDVAADGTRGGICLAWRGNVSVTLRSFSINHVNVGMKDVDNEKRWRFVSCYGSPYTYSREGYYYIS